METGMIERYLDYCEGGGYDTDLVDQLIVELSNEDKCSTCKNGTEEDGPAYDCYMSRQYFGYDHVSLPIDYGCNKWESK